MAEKWRRNMNYQSPPPWQLRYQSEASPNCRPPSGRTPQPLQPLLLPNSLKDLEKRVNTLEKSYREKTNTCNYLTRKVENLEKRLFNLEKEILKKVDATGITGTCSTCSGSVDLLQKATSAMIGPETENQPKSNCDFQDKMVELKLNDFRVTRDEHRAKSSTHVTQGSSSMKMNDIPHVRSVPISTELLILPDIRHYSKVEAEKHTVNCGTNKRVAEGTHITHESDTEQRKTGKGSSRYFYKPHSGKKAHESNLRTTHEQRNLEGTKKHTPKEAVPLNDHSGRKSIKPSEFETKAKRTDTEKLNEQNCDESSVSQIKYPSEAQALEQGIELEKPFPSPFTIIGKNESNEPILMTVRCLAELYQYEKEFKKISVLSLPD